MVDAASCSCDERRRARGIGWLSSGADRMRSTVTVRISRCHPYWRCATWIGVMRVGPVPLLLPHVPKSQDCLSFARSAIHADLVPSGDFV